MRLPNGAGAIVDIRKLTEYCLNPRHLRGRNKARVFAAVGITVSDAEELRLALLEAARNGAAEPGPTTEYGQRYVVDFELMRRGRLIRLRSAWIVRIGENSPYLTTCFVL
ncbi:MAG TPA: hypothetical protein VMS37_09270 [Verrucomicrobiae bacterium]|nr:hypothetical protein [Verrucomicrobiae bacterium]